MNRRHDRAGGVTKSRMAGSFYFADVIPAVTPALRSSAPKSGPVNRQNNIRKSEKGDQRG